MAVLPDVVETIRDGALGIVAPSSTNVQVKLGVSSLGTANTLYGFSDLNSLTTTLGVGPVVEAAATALAVAGGPVYVMPVNSSVPGTSGAVTNSGTGLSVLVPTGAPKDSYSVQVKIVAGGTNPAAGTATYQISLDGGNSFGPITSLPSSGVVLPAGTGLTLTFSAASLVAGDVYSFACTAPGFALTDLNAALTALLALPTAWAWVHVVGPAATVAASASMLAAVDTQMTAAESSYRYGFAVIECPADTDANTIAAFSSTSSKRVAVAAGFETVVSPITGRLMSRSIAFSMTARLQKISPATDVSRVVDGPLEGVRALSHDEQITQLLDPQRFSTARTIIGRQGFYITNGRIFAPTGSDFQFIHLRRVMDIASAVSRNAALNFLNTNVRVNANGTILEKDAKVIESQINSALAAALLQPGYVSAVSVLVNRTINITATQQLALTIRVLPLGYAKAITVDIGFANPSLVLS